jgi:hypothetical protein
MNAKGESCEIKKVEELHKNTDIEKEINLSQT